MWRITDDFWDHWDLLLDMFDRCEAWAGKAEAGSWPDCDMLPLGHIGIRSVDGGGADRWTRFTPDEQVTMMTLWSIFRSPLFFGGELRDNDAWTLSLLTNPDVLEMHRNSNGARLISRAGDRVVWTAEGDSGCRYAAMFICGENTQRVSVTLAELGLERPVTAKELWSGAEVGPVQDELACEIAPHGAVLYRLT